ncbi:MAG TPA: hypothetical protein VGP33_03305 [Chloroflexota bacterium]|nr:hypothetical protein [Chloroflexota bacterium]
MAKVVSPSVHPSDVDEEEITFHVMSPEEAWERFDQAAQPDLHVTGEAFIRAWDAGEFADEPERPEVVRVAMLRPLGR